MSNFASIVNNVITNIAIANAIGNLPASQTWVDITNVVPMPGIGWGAVETDGNWTFTAPTPVAPSVTLAEQKYITMNQLSAACRAAIIGGFPFTINGTEEYVTLSPTDQSNNQMAATVAQTALTASAWIADTNYAANSAVFMNNQPYVTFNAGTSGSTPPTWPTAFEVPAPDMDIDWYLMGFWIDTRNSTIMVDAATVISIYAAQVAYISNCRSKFQKLSAQVTAATTVAEVQAIVWS
jgi:hypothetical protein